MGAGIKRACESRRGRIRQIVTHLLAPNCAPVLEAESRRYAKTTSFNARKTLLIHPAEQELAAGKRPRVSIKALDKCASSLWEFDRIYYYLVQERSGAASTDRLIEAVEQEVERVRAVDGGASLIPQHYSIRALESGSVLARPDRRSRERAKRIDGLLSRIKALVEELGLDKGRQLRDRIGSFLTRLNPADAKRLTITARGAEPQGTGSRKRQKRARSATRNSRGH